MEELIDTLIGKQGSLSDVQRLCNELAQLREQNRVLREAVIWALGYHDFRERQEGEGPYWWRRELMHRSGLTQGDLDQAMRLDETAEQLTDIMLQHKKKAALTATSQPAKSAGKMHACDVPGCVSCGNPEDATSQERSVNKEG